MERRTIDCAFDVVGVVYRNKGNGVSLVEDIGDIIGVFFTHDLVNVNTKGSFIYLFSLIVLYCTKVDLGFLIEVDRNDILHFLKYLLTVGILRVKLVNPSHLFYAVKSSIVLIYLHGVVL